MKHLPLLISFFVLLLFASSSVEAQTNRKPRGVEPTSAASSSTAAFAEIALKRAEFEADLESLLGDYTDDFPKVKELRFALSKIAVESDRLKAMKAADLDRATSALGKLMVRKVESE